MAAAAAPESPARLCLILEMRIGGLSKAKGALCTVNQRRPPIEYSTLDPAQTLAGVNAEMRACIIRVYSSSSSSSSSHLKRGVRLSLGGSLCFRWDNRGILGARWFTSVPPRRRCKTNFVKAVGEPRILWSTLVAICFCSSKQGSFSEFFFFFLERATGSIGWSIPSVIFGLGRRMMEWNFGWFFVWKGFWEGIWVELDGSGHCRR